MQYEKCVFQLTSFFKPCIATYARAPVDCKQRVLILTNNSNERACSQSVDADVVHLQGNIVAVPGGQPLVAALPEVTVRHRRGAVPRLGAVAVDIRVLEERLADDARASHGHVELDVEVLVEGRHLGASLPGVVPPSVLVELAQLPEAALGRGDVADLIAVDGERDALGRPLGFFGRR